MLQSKRAKYSKVHFLKPGADWIFEDNYLNNLHLVENGNEKFALSIKINQNTIKESLCKINANEKKKQQLFLKENSFHRNHLNQLLKQKVEKLTADQKQPRY